MKIKQILIFGVSLLFVGSLQANYMNNYDPCCNQYCDPCSNSCYDFTLYGDYLYWNARKCELDYAMNEDTSESENIGPIYTVCPEYSSGFRVGGRIGSCNKDFGIRYTRYCNDQFNSVTNLDGNLAATRVGEDDDQRATSNGNIQFARGDYDVKLNVVDIEGGYNWEDCCTGSTARLFGGVKLAYIDQKLDILYAETFDDQEGNVDDIDLLHRGNDMNAYGIYAGAEGVLNLWCNLGLFARTSIGALVGDFERKYVHTFRENGNPEETNVDLHDDCHRVVSELELAVGLNYNFCSNRCGEWFIQLGYEFHQWWNTSDFIDVLSNNSGAQHVLDHHIDSLGYDGLFVRLGVSY